MPKRPLTRGDGVALRLLARVGMKQAREEPDPELAALHVKTGGKRWKRLGRRCGWSS